MTRKQETTQTNQLVEISTHPLTSKKLEKNVNNIIKALKDIEVGTWKYAINVNNIVVGELWRDDFSDLEGLASYLNTSKSTLIKCCKAVEFAVNNNLMEVYSVSKCYLLSTIDNYNEFIEWLNDNDMDINKLSKHALEKVIPAYNKRNDEAIENDENEALQDELIEIKYNKQLYRIPVKVLNKYLVTE